MNWKEVIKNKLKQFPEDKELQEKLDIIEKEKQGLIKSNYSYRLRSNLDVPYTGKFKDRSEAKAWYNTHGKFLEQTFDRTLVLREDIYLKDKGIYDKLWKTRYPQEVLTAIAPLDASGSMTIEEYKKITNTMEKASSDSILFLEDFSILNGRKIDHNSEEE